VDEPEAILTLAGMQPDQWQVEALRSRCSETRSLWLCSRQSGKSTTAAALALLTALLDPWSLVICVARAQRQSAELMLKIRELYSAVGRAVPAVAESALSLSLANGSRLVALPGSEQNIRGFSGAALIVIDEAARVPDETYKAVRPMLIVSGGSLVALSTAWAKSGWFFQSWTGPEDWQRVKVTAAECPRISPLRLAEERASLGERWFNMEYMCQFGEACESVFRPEDIERAFAPGKAKPLFAE
jgi:hypothetical protein